jgi:hypothetical protein
MNPDDSSSSSPAKTTIASRQRLPEAKSGRSVLEASNHKRMAEEAALR